MKKYLLIILSGLALQPAYAKSKKNQDQFPGNNLTQNILRKQAARNSAQKTTAANLRLIGYSYVANGAIMDSAHYYYSNGRGSDLTSVDAYADSYFAGMYDEKQTIKSDSSKAWSDWSGNGNLLLVNYKSYEYDVSNRPIKHRQAYLNNSYTSDVTHDISYDAQGKRTTDVQSDTFGNSPLIPKLQHYFLYDAQGKLRKDSLVSVIIHQELAKVEYVHDANGNLLSSTNYSLNMTTWEKTSSNDYTYDASNRLIKNQYTSYMWGSSAIQYGYYDTLEYAGSNPLCSTKTSQYWDANTSSWIPSYREEYQFNSAGAIDTYYLQQWDATVSVWDTTERDVYYYHPNGLIDYHHGFEYMGNGVFDAIPYDKQTYYYEEYYPTSVNTMSNDVHEIVIYPNPAQDRLHIKTERQGAGTLSIYNLQGQEVLKQSYRQLNGLDINTSALPAANYIINLKDNAGTVIDQRPITKQ